MTDVMIIGGGPAGVAAANYARARGLSVKLFESNKIGGLITLTTLVSHYPGLEAEENGISFGVKLESQLLANGTDIIKERVIKADLNSNPKKLYTDKGSYEGKVVIIATGTYPNIPDYIGKETISILPNAWEKLNTVSGKEVFVLGGSDGACKEAITLSKYAELVHIVHHGKNLTTIAEFADIINNSSNIVVDLDSEIHEVEGKEDEIKKVVINDSNGNKTEYAGSSYEVFAYIGQHPVNELFIDQLELENGYIKSKGIETNIPGVFSAGDINVKTVRQISTAVNDGTLAGIAAKNYIDNN